MMGGPLNGPRVVGGAYGRLMWARSALSWQRRSRGGKVPQNHPGLFDEMPRSSRGSRRVQPGGPRPSPQGERFLGQHFDANHTTVVAAGADIDWPPRQLLV